MKKTIIIFLILASVHLVFADNKYEQQLNSAKSAITNMDFLGAILILEPLQEKYTEDIQIKLELFRSYIGIDNYPNAEKIGNIIITLTKDIDIQSEVLSSLIKINIDILDISTAQIDLYKLEKIKSDNKTNATNIEIANLSKKIQENRYDWIPNITKKNLLATNDFIITVNNIIPSSKHIIEKYNIPTITFILNSLQVISRFENTNGTLIVEGFQSQGDGKIFILLNQTNKIGLIAIPIGSSTSNYREKEIQIFTNLSDFQLSDSNSYFVMLKDWSTRKNIQIISWKLN